MADTKVLLAGLEKYHESLNRHLADLTAEYQQLEGSWRRFSSVYQGTAADQFRANWMRTVTNFQEYITQTGKISKMLEDRIEKLRIVNRTEGVLG